MRLSAARMGAQAKRGAEHGPPAIEVTGLVKRYGQFVAVDGIDLTVQTGEIFGILGPNGAGKTTTLEMIEGLRTPDAGRVTVAGVDAIAHPDAIKRMIGVQLQTTALFDHLTARELVGLFASLYGADSSSRRVDQLMSMVGLTEKSGAYVDTMSGGQQQRLSIALALVNDPRIVFLDEPTTGLDPQGRHNLWDVIQSVRSGGKTIVLTTHYMEEAEVLCDRVAVMDAGKIVACDSPRGLIDSLDLPTTIRARLTPAEVSSADLRALDGVTSVDVSGDIVEVRTVMVPATVAGLLALVEQRRLRLDQLTMFGATLEDVFLHLTGRRLRE